MKYNIKIPKEYILDPRNNDDSYEIAAGELAISQKETMKPIQRGDEWWIADMPDRGENCGPYGSEKEARDSIGRLEQFYKRCDEPGFMTTGEKP